MSDFSFWLMVGKDSGNIGNPDKIIDKDSVNHKLSDKCMGVFFNLYISLKEKVYLNGFATVDCIASYYYRLPIYIIIFLKNSRKCFLVNSPRDTFKYVVWESLLFR